MKVILIGIDALDREVVDKYIDRLPTFRRLRDEGARVPLRSVFPPDSDTAWASIYTAQNPARHGILNFTDALSKSADHSSHDVPNTVLRGKTFWDVASAAGKRVCLIHPHIGYPPWDVNGVFVGRSSVSDAVEARPEGALPAGFDLTRLRLPRGFPNHRDLGEYLGRHTRLVEAQRELSLALYEREPWDLFFAYSSSIDMVKHFYWSFADESDPSHPGDTPWKGAIADLYVQHDRWIGDLWKRAGPDTAVVVVGDHGHGRRPTKVVHLNEILRNEGLLVPSGGVKRPAAGVIEKTKETLVKIVSGLHLENLAAKALRALPSARKMFTAPPAIDWNKTTAYMSDLSGIKAYAYGGIRIRPDAPDRDQLAARIIGILDELKTPDGRKLATWVGRASDVYDGPYLDRYPDILYQMVDDYGASPRLKSGIFGVSASSAMVPGTHRIDTPEFLIAGASVRPRGAPAGMVDVGATVLQLLGLPTDPSANGRPVAEVK